MVGVEVVRQDASGDLLEVGPGIEYARAVGGEDGKAAATEGVQVVVAAFFLVEAEGGGHVQPAQLLVGLECVQLVGGKARVALADRGDVLGAELFQARFLGVAVPVAGVAFVGQHQVGFPVDVVGGDGIWLQDRLDRPVGDVDLAVLIGGVERHLAAIDVAQRPDVLHLG